MCELCDNTIFMFSAKKRIQLNKELKVDDVVAKAINQLYDDRKVDNETQSALFTTHFEPLKKAVEEGYGKPLAKIEYGTPNYEFLKQLQVNTAVFSMFKTHASLKEMAGKLKDDAGNLRSRETFKQEALKVDATYRTDHLDTQYDTAVRQARMAANWQRYVKNKRLYPNLTYIQSKAAKPDAKHLLFVGITLPLDDPFWLTNYPPNRWRCQCSVEPTDAEATDLPTNLPEVPKEFAFNSGMTGQVFDIKNSEYIKSVPAKDQPALIKQAEKYVVKDIAAKAEYQPVYKSKKGGTVDAHPLAFDNNDFNAVLKEARSYVNETGKAIKILPDVQDKSLRTQLTAAGTKGLKSPDYLIDGKYAADLKIVSKSTRTAIREAFKRCYDQCDNILLKIDDNNTISSHELYRYSKGVLNVGFSKMENVSIYFEGKWHDTTRADILKGNWPINNKGK
jgi:hypothetical protein